MIDNFSPSGVYIAAWMDLSGYSLDTVQNRGEFLLCRGHQRMRASSHPSSVLVLMPRSEPLRPESLQLLEQEHSLKAQLDPAWAVQPMALADDGRRTVLVLEDPGGEPRDQLLETLMELRLFLRLAVALSGAVRELHRRRIIHKNIKPANVMFKPNTGEVWLMGFGIASRLPRERQAAESPEFIAGTLAYMAPEQTGRMNRSIDSRRSLCPRSHAIRSDNRHSALYGIGSDGVCILPHSQTACAARCAPKRSSAPRIGDHYAATRQDG